MTPGGQVLKEGDFVRQPDLANALSNIRANGPVDFYQGKYASFLVDAVANAGGSLSLEGLKVAPEALVPVFETGGKLMLEEASEGSDLSNRDVVS